MKILIKGAGDLATGIAAAFFRKGHQVVMTEIACPLTVRRQVAFSRTVYDGSSSCKRCKSDAAGSQQRQSRSDR